jgi:Lrp/AsnC family transcriptional regulator, regulator for asnA, asnC and gidA
MDKLDYLILSELLKDASLSFVEIAKRVHASHYSVRRRFEKMKKEGVIQNCLVSIDLSKLGYQGKALLLIHVSPECIKSDTIAYLLKIRNIIAVSEIAGAYDIIAIAPIKDLDSIQTLVKEAKKAPHVEGVDIACINDCGFPIGPDFNKELSERSYMLANR